MVLAASSILVSELVRVRAMSGFHDGLPQDSRLEPTSLSCGCRRVVEALATASLALLELSVKSRVQPLPRPEPCGKNLPACWQEWIALLLHAWRFASPVQQGHSAQLRVLSLNKPAHRASAKIGVHDQNLANYAWALQGLRSSSFCNVFFGLVCCQKGHVWLKLHSKKVRKLWKMMRGGLIPSCV